MHLAAGAYRSDPLPRAFDRAERVTDRGGDARPPVKRPLLRPAELRHDLIVLARRDVKDRARQINERGADAAGADIDGKREVARHAFSASAIRRRIG